MKTKLMQWLHRSAVYGKLRNKLLCIYFLLIVIPLGFFSLYTYLRVKNVIQKQTFSAAQNAFDDTRLSMQRLWGQLDRVIDILTTEPLTYAMASNNPEDFTYIRRLEDSDQLNTTFEHLRILSGVSRIQLYVNNDYPYSNDRANIIQIDEVAQSIWCQMVFPDSKRVWCAPTDFEDQEPDEQQWFSSVQTIYDPYNVKEPLAMIRADIHATEVSEIINGTSITNNGLMLILRENDILLSSDTTISKEHLISLVENLQNLNPGKWEMIAADKIDYYVQCESLGSSDWQLVSVLPCADVFQLSRELSREMLCIVILVTLAAYLLAYFISQSTLNRISQLTGTMQAIKEGNVTVRLEPAGNDEIAQLMGGFNQMMDRVDMLLEQKVEYGRQIKNLELKALQAQINPHFLYNSLDLINCTAISRNVPEISRIVNALGRFYRLSLSKGREVIDLADEVKHAQLYVKIQNMRFENSIAAHWEIDPSAARCQIIKIILQPLIENAIIHGIFEKPSKRGQLWVSVHRKPDGIRIVIADDGVGMTESARIMNFTSGAPDQITATAGGYGIHNVQDRLRLAYGEPFGLFCESTPGEGTTVTVYIPAIEPPQDQEES